MEQPFHGGPNAILLKYDANHDGTVTREELNAGLKAEFERYDTAHQGCLNPDQVAAINQARVEADQSTATPLQDWNQDGCIDLKEYSSEGLSLFDELDRNGDGKVTPQEMNPGGGRATPQQGGPGERGGRAGRGG